MYGRDGTIIRMPGCSWYVVGAELEDPNAIAVIEIWDGKASHEDSLKLESVRSTIGRARPLIAGFGSSTEFVPRQEYPAWVRRVRRHPHRRRGTRTRGRGVTNGRFPPTGALAMLVS